MKIIDKYILKKYLSSILVTVLVLIPIAIAIDISQKIDKFLRNPEITLNEIIVDYYLNFIVYYAITFLPLALFIAVIMFTSRISANTEIIAIHDAKVSFTRLLKSYFIGATVVVIISMFTSHFIVPESNKTRIAFEQKIKRKKASKALTDICLQYDNTYTIHIKSFDIKNNKGKGFTIYKTENNKIVSSLYAKDIIWQEKDSVFRLKTYNKRYIGEKEDRIYSGRKLDTLFQFTLEDLKQQNIPPNETKSFELHRMIKQSEERGVKNLNPYYVELYRRTSMPISAYILTLIAVCLASKKKRGGIGINLAIGLALMFIYVFFMKATEVLGGVAEANSLLMVWIPNIIFGTLSIFLYFHAKK